MCVGTDRVWGEGGDELGKINNIEHSGAVSELLHSIFIQCHAGLSSPPDVANLEENQFLLKYLSTHIDMIIPDSKGTLNIESNNVFTRRLVTLHLLRRKRLL